MRNPIDELQRTYRCEIMQWNEPAGAGDGAIYSAYQRGRLVIAESLSLLISALQDAERRPMLLAA